MGLYRRNNIWYVDAFVNGKRGRISTGIIVNTGDVIKDKLNKKEAERIELQKKSELARRYTGGETIHEWLEKGQRRQLKRWKTILPKDLKWSDISLQFLQDLVRGFEKHGIINRDRKTGAVIQSEYIPYSPSTIHSYLDEITTMLKRASKRGECDFPDWDRKDIYSKPRTSKKKRVVHTNEEIEKLMKTDIIFKNDILDEIWDTPSAWKFVLTTGLRFGDIKNLRWKDISDNELIITQQKTKLNLQIPLNRIALDILKSMKENRTCLNDDDKIFNLPNHVTTLEHLDKWRKAAGIKTKVLWHAGRRDYASMLHEGGADIYTISNLLGHSDVKVTQRYVVLKNTKKQKAVENLNNILNNISG